LLERAAAGSPAEPTINEHLGDAYWTSGRELEARYAWRAALVTAEEKDRARLNAKIDGGLDKGTAAP
jgi:predicted negative regulator of RcsB-dependent stress response